MVVQRGSGQWAARGKVARWTVRDGMGYHVTQHEGGQQVTRGKARCSKAKRVRRRLETTTEKWVADDRGTEGHIGAREGQGPEHGTRSIWGLKAGKRCPDVGEKSGGYDAPELLVEQAQSIFYILQHSTLILPVSREGEVLLRLLLVLDDGREQEALYYYSEIQVVYIVII